MAAEEFTIEEEKADNGVVVVRLTGYLDAHTFERLEKKIAELFAAGSHKIIADLSSVQYISSAGAGVFIGALSEAQEHNGNIVLLNPTPNVREVFDLLGLTEIFKVVTDRSEALSEFKI